MKIRFKDLAKGARFKYPDGTDTWVVLEAYRNGLVAKWIGARASHLQSLCCFVDEDWTLESEVEVVDDSDLIHKLNRLLDIAFMHGEWSPVYKEAYEEYKHMRDQS
jgi:hypothetical protein